MRRLPAPKDRTAAADRLSSTPGLARHDVDESSMDLVEGLPRVNDKSVILTIVDGFPRQRTSSRWHTCTSPPRSLEPSSTPSFAYMRSLAAS
jgi:hypothetical protein